MRDQRGVVLPSPLVMLSVIAVAMAAIAFVATRGGEPTEREITPAARESVEPSATAEPSAKASPKPTKAPEPAVDRSKVYVEVYNNSAVTGLAGRIAQKAGDVGWQVVGADNWYGTIPTSTVYYPKKLERAAKLLALDLGIERTAPAVEPMRMDRLTLILTGELD
ncbi:MAG: LytR C-terminal domain-containing protein [Nocardioides sp.]